MSDVWYYEFLAHSMMLKQSKLYSPHYDMDHNLIVAPLSDSKTNPITKDKCIIEFGKPLCYNYNSLLTKNGGYNISELCHVIKTEWDNIQLKYYNWIDKNHNLPKIISDIYVYEHDTETSRSVFFIFFIFKTLNKQ